MAGYGFQPLRKMDGSPYIGAMAEAYLATASQAYFKGDPLVYGTGAANTSPYGEVLLAAATSQIIVGVAQYFEWTDADGNFHQANTVPAATVNTAAIEVKVYYVHVDGHVVFKCIADDDTTPLTAFMINSNCDFVATAGNATTGYSGFVLDSSSETTTSTLPLRLIGLHNKPGNAFGNTAGTVEVEVVFNQTAYAAGIAGLA